MGGRYDPLYELGAGAFGKAWVVRDNRTQTKCVSKVIQIKGLSSNALDRCVTEVAVLSACSHLNIVRYKEAFVSSGALHIVMEFASGGDLQQKIEKQNGVFFRNDIVLDWFIQIILALEYIHSKNILHRDLKPQNVFLTDKGIVKLGDFGIARVLNSCDDLASTRIGTPFYISPEICEGKPYNSSSDMWAAGCLLYQTCTLHVPFHASNFDDLTRKIIKAEFDPIPSHFSDIIKLMVSKLLVGKPSNRLTASQLLSLEPLHGMVFYLKNRHYPKGQRSRSNSVVPNRSRVQFLQKERSSSVSRLQKNSVPANDLNLEAKCQFKGQFKGHSKTEQRTAAEGREINIQKGAKKGNDLAEKNSIKNSLVRNENENVEKERIVNNTAENKETNENQANTNREVNSCRVKPLRDIGSANEEADNTSIRSEEFKLEVDRKNKVVNSKTFTIKDSVARRLSEASPKLSQTVRKQRFSLSISEPYSSDKAIAGKESNHDNEEDLKDDVFQSPSLSHKPTVNSQTYLVKERAYSNANNNNIESGYSDVDKEETKDRGNNAMIQALSVSKIDKELARNLLYGEIRLKIGIKRKCQHLINQVRQLIVEDGQSYQYLKCKLNEKELSLIPLICMYLTLE